MSKEVTPTWGIETYYKDPTFYPYLDNNRVPIDTNAKVFDTYMPCDFVSNTLQNGGGEQIIFTESDDKKLPQDLKDGLMSVSDVLFMQVKGPGYKG